MRQHRIDMNLFVDFNPNQFLNNIKEFVFQINNADHFNLFLSNLRFEKKIYKNFYFILIKLQK